MFKFIIQLTELDIWVQKILCSLKFDGLVISVHNHAYYGFPMEICTITKHLIISMFFILIHNATFSFSIVAKYVMNELPNVRV
jgi:hypothetical protein